jgi:hypothetical protein
MQRVIVPLVFSIAVLLGLTQGTPSPSTAAVAAMIQTTPTPTPPGDLCPDPTAVWQDAVDVRPDAAAAAKTRPLDVTGDQDFYLVIWTLRPGTCVPYTAEGNQKDGAVILMVQQGIIDFTAEHYGDDTTAQVLTGRVSSASGTVLTFGETKRLYPGDWVTMDDQVWFTYTSVGGESAVVLKAVWAKIPDSGCGGGCK